MDPTLGVALLALAGTVVTAVLTYRASKQATSATDRSNRDNALLKFTERLEASEKVAREEARESRERADRIRDEADADVQRLRSQLDELHIQLQMATSATANLTDTLLSVAAEVWRPEPDIGALRRLVGRPGSGSNGRP